MPPPPRIAVIDYGSGNLRSVAKALLRSGLDARVSDDPDALRASAAAVLPGAGAFADAMDGLRARGLDEAVREHIATGRPYLGLCLGLQVLFALWLDVNLIGVLAIVWCYMALMGREFFVPAWLRARPFLYLVSHMVVVPLVDLYATACDWLVAAEPPPPGSTP